MRYDHGEIEKKWQEYWKEHETFKTDVWDFSKPTKVSKWLEIGFQKINSDSKPTHKL